MSNIQVREEYAKLVYDGETLVGMFKREKGGLKLFKIKETDYSRVHEIFGSMTPAVPSALVEPGAVTRIKVGTKE